MLDKGSSRWGSFRESNTDPIHPDCELWCCSDEENDEDMDSIYYLPVAPEIDDPEETGWTQEVCGKNRTLVRAS